LQIFFQSFQLYYSVSWTNCQ